MPQDPQPPADEVRTRRLVIVDQDGTERIVAEVVKSIAEVRVALPEIDGHTGSAQLYAAEHDGQGGFGPMIGLQIWADGNVRAGLDVWPEGWGWKSALYQPDEAE
ncbi:MAG TPA: hypothetical protein VHB02_17835 [Acidimicrobiales bacterium]|nr:hypothetical protein [Acidimicrobiales bacterium]